jgi:hypothetical protein
MLSTTLDLINTQHLRVTTFQATGAEGWEYLPEPQIKAFSSPSSSKRSPAASAQLVRQGGKSVTFVSDAHLSMRCARTFARRFAFLILRSEELPPLKQILHKLKVFWIDEGKRKNKMTDRRSLAGQKSPRIMADHLRSSSEKEEAN